MRDAKRPNKARSLPLIVAVVSAAFGPASAQDGAPVQPQKVDGAQPAWTVACTSAGRTAPADCRLEQRLFSQEGGQLLSVAVIAILAANRAPVLSVDLPNAIALPQGVFVAVDAGASVPMAVQSCDGRACNAVLPVSPAMLAGMQAGKVLTVSATALNGTKLSFPHLLADFATSYEAAR